jgi:peptidoglycan/xylan/chitin deacetylase (PgdA/CDA1 family)
VSVKVPTYKGSSKDEVSLMFNVYWGTEYLDLILETLESYEIKTTFFVGGCWVEKNHDYLRKIVAKGHEVGNHGYFHKDHKKLSVSENKNEIESCHKLVKAITGIDMNLFAPPSGSFSSKTLDIAEEIGYNTIMWSLDTIDWRDKDVSLIVKRATEKAGGGYLILMHPTKETLEALPIIIEKLSAKGLSVAKVTEVL